MLLLKDEAAVAETFKPPGLGCVLCLPGLPGSSGKIHDRSPYGNTGTITGAVWERLPSGLWVLHFDGTDDNVSIAHHASLNLSAEMTHMAWIYPDSFPELTNRIFDKLQAYAISARNNGEITVEAWSIDGNQTSSGVGIATTTWQHIAVVYSLSAGKILFYKNGVLKDTNPITVQASKSSYNLGIGGRPSYSANKPYNGLIGETRIYEMAMTPAQLQDDYLATKWRYE